jgi:hypothetical protein
VAVATFDTLKFADTLKAAGVPAAQAEGQARAFAEIIQVQVKDLVVKDDLERVAERLKRDLVEETLKLSARIERLETKTEWQFTMLRWMLGATLSGVVALVIRTFFMRPGM